MKFVPSSSARRSTARACLASRGSPQTSSPVTRIAPKPRRLTSRSPPINNRPAAAAGCLRSDVASRFETASAAGPNAAPVAAAVARIRKSRREELSCIVSYSGNPIFLTPPIGTASALESALSLCCCLPSIRPLFRSRKIRGICPPMYAACASELREGLVENMADGTPRFPGRIGLGTFPMGESRALCEQELAAVQHALEVGYRLLDTAEKYGDGGAERIIGRALQAFGAARRSA